MTDIDYQADLMLNYVDHELHAMIPLTAPVSEIWRQRYEALAQAKDVQALVRPRREGPAMLLLTVPARMKGDDVEALLETARALIAEADAVDQEPTSSTAPEAVARMVGSSADLTAAGDGNRTRTITTSAARSR